MHGWGAFWDIGMGEEQMDGAESKRRGELSDKDGTPCMARGGSPSTPSYLLQSASYPCGFMKSVSVKFF